MLAGQSQGAAADLDYFRRAIELARRYDFALIVDECYAEIYTRAPPVGALEAAAALDGRLDNVLVFHSLSKRSSAAGLRSGFVAGDPALLAAFASLRSYGAAVQPLPILAAATALWQDEGTWSPVAPCIRPSSTWPTVVWLVFSTMSGQMAGSFCGSRWATVRR